MLTLDLFRAANPDAPMADWVAAATADRRAASAAIAAELRKAGHDVMADRMVSPVAEPRARREAIQTWNRADPILKKVTF